MESIKLNVGGIKIETYKSTLLQLDYFKAKLERWNENDETELFVDYDYDIFKHLINKLRDSSYKMPKNKNVENMCNYFGYNYIKPKKGHVSIVGGSYEIKDANSFILQLRPNEKLIKFTVHVENKSSFEISFIQNDKPIFTSTNINKRYYFKESKDILFYESYELELNYEVTNILRKISNLKIKITGKYIYLEYLLKSS
jgi:hypothetical protein